MTKPRIIDDPMYLLLREGRIEEFNARRAEGVPASLAGTDLRGLDLRNLVADGLDLRDAYFRLADLRGIDFRKADLEGASFASANISGCYFPPDLRADELMMSVMHGTRVRYQR